MEEKFARNSTMENKGKVEMGAQADDVLENKLNNIIDDVFGADDIDLEKG